MSASNKPIASASLILASSSPRRRELLIRAGLRFDIVASGIDETRLPGEEAGAFALRMARDKALAVSHGAAEAIVLSADTIVVCAGQILGKPDGADGARAMLAMLSGNTHVVITAFALARGGKILENEAVESRVTFRALTGEEIDAYVASGEPLDKAGAYGIQGIGGGFISQVDGPRDNVMGLPVESVLLALARQGVSP
jgi:septum formation protein